MSRRSTLSRANVTNDIPPTPSVRSALNRGSVAPSSVPGGVGAVSCPSRSPAQVSDPAAMNASSCRAARRQGLAQLSFGEEAADLGPHASLAALESHPHRVGVAHPELLRHDVEGMIQDPTQVDQLLLLVLEDVARRQVDELVPFLIGEARDLGSFLGSGFEKTVLGQEVATLAACVRALERCDPPEEHLERLPWLVPGELDPRLEEHLLNDLLDRRFRKSAELSAAVDPEHALVLPKGAVQPSREVGIRAPLSPLDATEDAGERVRRKSHGCATSRMRRQCTAAPPILGSSRRTSA